MGQKQVVRLELAAPDKPEVGAPCNGCGVCCAAEPCPVGRVISMRRSGACKALEWDGERYRCGFLLAPERYIPLPLARTALRAWAGRVIAAGAGCDSDVEIE
jgi:hypothetical protein